MATTRLTARWVIAWDGRDHRTLENGELVFDDGGRILFVGRGWQGVADRSVDCGNAVIGPGFVDLDALGDIDSTILGFDNTPGWRKGRIWPEAYLARGPYDALDADTLDLAKRWAYVNLLRHGITTALPITSIIYRAWSETAEEYDRAVDIAAEVGIRAYLGPAYCSGRTVVDAAGVFRLHLDSERGMAGLRDAVAFARRHDGAHGGLVRGFLAPDRIEGCTEGLLRASRDAAVDLGLPIRLHCCQSRLEVETMQERFGRGSLEVLEDLGFLDARPLLPHAINLGGAQPSPQRIAADLDRLADSGSTVVHCPLVMARHGDALDSFRRLRARGIAIGMGTDTFPADMLLNLQAGVMLARIVEGDIAAASAADLYRVATIGGADALRRPDLGRLAAGAAADVTVFDLGDPRTGPFVDPVQSMVLAGAGVGFRDVYVAGRRVVRDGRPADHDLDALHHDVNRAYAAFRGTYPDRTPGSPPAGTIFAPAFERWEG